MNQEISEEERQAIIARESQNAGEARSQLQAAVAYIRAVGRNSPERRTSTGGGAGAFTNDPDQAHLQRLDENAALEDFARQNGLPLNAEPPAGSEPKIPGKEHDVWVSPDGARYYKRTLPVQEDGRRPDALKGQTGLSVQINPDNANDWGLLPSQPSDYRDRLVLNNERFDDDIKLDGLWRDSRSNGWHISTG